MSRLAAIRAARMAVLMALVMSPVAARAQPLVADPAVLHLRASQAADGRWHSTPSRVVRLDRTDTTLVPWRAASTVPWLTVTPSSGEGPARLWVQLDPAHLDGISPVGEVVIAVDGAAVQRVTVHAAVVSADQPPIGVIDAPADGEVHAGLVRLFGWVLDDVGINSVEICRMEDTGQDAARCADGRGVRVGLAELHVADRPDVAAAFPGFEHSGPAAWTAVLSMPVTGGSPASYYALARDVAGHVASLGARNYSVVSPPMPWTQAFGPPAIVLVAVLAFIVFHRWARRGLPVRGDSPPLAVHSPPQRPGPKERAALVAILAAFAWMAIPTLDRSLDYDEMYSASQFIVDQSWWTSATRVQTSNNHFGNSVLASAAVRLLGPHEWAVRLPAFLLALGAIVVTWRFGRRLAGPATGLCAAALLASAPAFLAWGQSARGYSGLACLAWLSVDAYFRVLRTGDPRQAHVHTVATALLPVFHLFGFWILAIQYLAFWGWGLAWRRSARTAASADGLQRLHGSFLIIGVVALLVFVPNLGNVVRDLPASGHAPASAVAPAAAGSEAARQAPRRDGVRWAGFQDELLASRSPMVLFVGGVLVVMGVLRLPRKEAWLGIATLAVPLFVLWMASRSITIYVLPRFFSFWLPMLAILLAAGIVAPLQWHREWASRVRGGAALAAAVLTIAGGLFLARTWLEYPRTAGGGGYREWLTPPPQWTGGALAVVGQDAFMFDYYLGKPVSRIIDPAQLDWLLRQPDRLLVAYHDLPRVRAADQLVRARLMRSCVDHPRAIIVLFECR